MFADAGDVAHACTSCLLSNRHNLDLAGRMTVSNMTIEAGARAGLIAPDQQTFDYIAGRDFAPKGEAWDRAVA